MAVSIKVSLAFRSRSQKRMHRLRLLNESSVTILLRVIENAVVVALAEKRLGKVASVTSISGRFAYVFSVEKPGGLAGD